MDSCRILKRTASSLRIQLAECIFQELTEGNMNLVTFISAHIDCFGIFSSYSQGMFLARFGLLFS